MAIVQSDGRSVADGLERDASADGDITAMQIFLKPHPEFPRLRNLRDELLFKRFTEGLDPQQEVELERLLGDAFEDADAVLRTTHVAAPEHQRDTDLVTLLEEAAKLGRLRLEIVVVDVIATGDAAGLIGVGVTIFYDEATFISGGEFTSVNLPGMGNSFTPLSLGVVDAGDRLNGFDQATLATGCISCTVTLGSFKFAVGPGSGPLAETDIIAAVVPGTADDIIAGNGGVVSGSTLFSGVTIVPEPMTAILLVVGVAGLGFAGRRSVH